MGGASVRAGLTSRGILALSPWTDTNCIYSVAMLNLGNNFISSLEIVSSLNVLNLARGTYHYNYESCLHKYNPKLYLGTIQGIAQYWNHDIQKLGSNTASDPEKSGSWPGDLNSITFFK